nr:hypothetical protein Iba_chr03aCG10830 [Ipomoea batatas]
MVSGIFGRPGGGSGRIGGSSTFGGRESESKGGRGIGSPGFHPGGGSGRSVGNSTGIPGFQPDGGSAPRSGAVPAPNSGGAKELEGQAWPVIAKFGGEHSVASWTLAENPKKYTMRTDVKPERNKIYSSGTSKKS